MTKIKYLVLTMILTLIVTALPVQAQRSEHRNRGGAEHHQGDKTSYRKAQRQERPLLRTEHRPPFIAEPQHRNRDRDWGQDRNRRVFPRPNRGFRIVILPRLTFRFPYRYHGYIVNNIYDCGYKDGYLKGRADFAVRLGCDPNFTFDYKYSRNESYIDGFLKGYREGCKL